MTTTVSWHRAPAFAPLVVEAAGIVAGWLADGLAVRPDASLVVSGGRTPEPLHEALSAQPLPWARVAVTLADERWVPAGDPASNEAMVRRTLIRDAAARARFTSLYADAPAPEDALDAVHARVAALPRPWDVVLLGMGGDGHTASLFPGGDRLAAALDGASGRLCEAMRAPGAAQPRITLTLPCLLAARRVALLVTGADKAAVLERALRPGPVAELPIRAVLHQNRVPVTIFWAP